MSQVKTYVIHAEPYMHSKSETSQFRGTWRELLVSLCSPRPLGDGFDDDTAEELEGVEDEVLLQNFEDMNGDGAPYVTVWCVEDEKVVVGGDCE